MVRSLEEEQVRTRPQTGDEDTTLRLEAGEVRISGKEVRRGDPGQVTLFPPDCGSQHLSTS